MFGFSQPKLMDTAASKRKREELEALRQRTYNLVLCSYPFTVRSLLEPRRKAQG